MLPFVAVNIHHPEGPNERFGTTAIVDHLLEQLGPVNEVRDMLAVDAVNVVHALAEDGELQDRIKCWDVVTKGNCRLWNRYIQCGEECQKDRQCGFHHPDTCGVIDSLLSRDAAKMALSASGGSHGRAAIGISHPNFVAGRSHDLKVGNSYSDRAGPDTLRAPHVVQVVHRL